MSVFRYFFSHDAFFRYKLGVFFDKLASVFRKVVPTQANWINWTPFKFLLLNRPMIFRFLKII